MGEKISKAMLDDLISRGATVGPSAAEAIERAGGVTTKIEMRDGPVVGEWVTATKATKQPKCPNKLEQSYASHLEVLKRLGDIVDYKFESVKLKIGVKTCWFCPDFWVLAKDGVSEYHETKGFMRDDALVKLKSAALQYPHFRFFLVRKDGKRFSVEAVK